MLYENFNAADPWPQTTDYLAAQPIWEWVLHLPEPVSPNDTYILEYIIHPVVFEPAGGQCSRLDHQGQQTFSVKSQIINVLGLVGHVESLPKLPLTPEQP